SCGLPGARGAFRDRHRRGAWRRALARSSGPGAGLQARSPQSRFRFSPAMPTAALDVQREMLLLVTARVRDAYLRRPVYVDAALDLASVCREMARLNVTSVLLRDGERLGLFTTTDLRDAVVRGTSLERVPVRDAARFELITVRPDCELFEALWLMERHRVHRLVVC